MGKVGRAGEGPIPQPIPEETKVSSVDLVNGTSKTAQVVVSIGDSQITANGLKDLVPKLQNLERQLRSEERKLDE